MGIKKGAVRLSQGALQKAKDASDLKKDATIVVRTTTSAWSRFTTSVHRIVDEIKKFLPFIIAVMMIAYGAARWYNCINGQQSFVDSWYLYISSTIMIICGILMAVFYKAPMTTLIGFFTIGVASNRLLQGLQLFFRQYDNNFVMLGTLIVSVIFIGLASNMLISSTFYLRGISRKRRGMLISAILFIIIEVIVVVIDLRSGMTFGEVFQTDPSRISRIALYCVYILLLSTQEIRDRELLEHQSRVMDGIRATYICDPFARIDRPEAIKVANLKNDRSIWKDKRGWGPVEYEYRFVIKNRYDHSYITVQKWKDSDRLYFTVAKNHHGSLLDANRFPVDDILLDGSPEGCTVIRFYNREGLFIQIPISEKKENDLNDGFV